MHIVICCIDMLKHKVIQKLMHAHYYVCNAVEKVSCFVSVYLQ